MNEKYANLKEYLKKHFKKKEYTEGENNFCLEYCTFLDLGWRLECVSASRTIGTTYYNVDFEGIKNPLEICLEVKRTLNCNKITFEEFEKAAKELDLM